jgi:manganese-dependent inorganic pyrophosphatase
MLKAGASTTDKSAEELLDMDAKSFNMGDYVTVFTWAMRVT